MLFQRVVQSLQPPFHPKECGKTVQHLDSAKVFVVKVEGGLPRGLQGLQQAQLELLQPCQMLPEFCPVKDHLGSPEPARIVQLPLAGDAGDLPADIAVKRVAGQDDLGTTGVSEDKVQNAGIVIVKEAKAGKAFGFCSQLAQKCARVQVTFGKGKTEKLCRILFADEMRVENLTVAGDTGQRVQVCLQKVRSGAHFGKNDKAVEPDLHAGQPPRPVNGLSSPAPEVAEVAGKSPIRTGSMP